jgi:hypothetical protein
MYRFCWISEILSRESVGLLSGQLARSEDHDIVINSRPDTPTKPVQLAVELHLVPWIVPCTSTTCQRLIRATSRAISLGKFLSKA